MSRTPGMVGAVIATAIVAAFGAVSAGAGPPAVDKAEGAGTYGPGCSSDACFPTEHHFSFSAQSQGFSGRAIGFYSEEHLTGTGELRRFVGRVTCLNVLGSTAVFGGFLTEAPAGVPVGTPFVEWVVDNGPPSEVPDLITPTFVFLPGETPPSPAFPNVCPEPVSPVGYFPLTSGDIVVRNESPGPPIVAG